MKSVYFNLFYVTRHQKTNIFLAYLVKY